MWPRGIAKPGRVVDDYVSFIDLAPTFLEVAGLPWAKSGMAASPGRSLTDILRSEKSGRINPARDHVLIGMERHDIGRPGDVGTAFHAGRRTCCPRIGTLLGVVSGRPFCGGGLALVELGHLAGLAFGQDLALAQRQHPALEVGHAAPAQMLVDHPQVHILDRLELGVLHGLEGQAMLLADAIAVVPVDQDVAPQHQRIPAALGQQAALQRLVLLGGQGVDVGLEFFANDDGAHTGVLDARCKGCGF
mgnify:CR=1 FL=1